MSIPVAGGRALAISTPSQPAGERVTRERGTAYVATAEAELRSWDDELAALRLERDRTPPASARHRALRKACTELADRLREARKELIAFAAKGYGDESLRFYSVRGARDDS